MGSKEVDTTVSAEEWAGAKAILGKKGHGTLLSAYWITKQRPDGSKEHRRLLCIGNHHIASLKKSRGKLEVRRIGHIYSLERFEMLDGKTIKLTWPTFVIQFISSNQENIVMMLHTAIRRITVDFPLTAKPQRSLPEELSEDRVLSVFVPGPGGSFLDIYRAHCAKLEIAPSEEVEEYFRSLFEAQCTDIDLNDLPEVCHVPKHPSYVDMTPLFAALRYNAYFSSITFMGIPRKEMLRLVGSIVGESRSLRRIQIVDVDAHDGFDAIGEAIENLKIGSALHTLELSGNKCTAGAGMPFARGISNTRFPLARLHLSSCGLQSRVMCALVEGIAGNELIRSSLLEISFDGNDMSEVPLSSIDALLGGWAEGCALEYLNIADTDVRVLAIVRGIRGCLADNIVELDLCGNEILEGEGEELAQMASRVTRLEVLGLSKMKKLQINVLAMVSNALANNTALAAHPFALDISDNKIGRWQEEVVAETLKWIAQMPSLVYLDLSGSELTADLVRVVFDQISKSESLTNLSLCREMVVANAKESKKRPLSPRGGSTVLPSFVKETTACVLRSARLKSLRLTAIADASTAKAFLPLYDCITNSSRIVELDIASNHIGDEGLLRLVAALKINKSVSTLRWDENDATDAVWTALLDVLKISRVLQVVEKPSQDIARLASGNAKKDAEAGRRYALLWDRIFDRLSSNRILEEQSERITGLISRAAYMRSVRFTGSRGEVKATMMSTDEVRRGLILEQRESVRSISRVVRGEDVAGESAQTSSQ